MFQEENTEEQSTIFCRAIYDYKPEDPSALSLRTGDVIEILTKQPSGWWDGLLRDARGWFPSNYVEIISDEEADQAFSRLETLSENAREQPESDIWKSLGIDKNAPMKSAEDETKTLFRNEMPISSRYHIHSSDFWVPEVTSDGQIYYVNTETGLRSRDLPNDIEHDSSDNEHSDPEPSVQDMRPSLPFGPKKTKASTDDPEVKYPASENSTIMDLTTTRAPVHGPTSSPINPAPRVSDVKNLMPHPGSDVLYTPDYEANVHVKNSQINVPPSPTQYDVSVAGMISDQRVAEAFQQALEPQPPSPSLIGEVSSVAQDAIQHVLTSIRSSKVTHSPEVDQIMDHLVYNVVLAVRNMLYIAAALPINQTSEVAFKGGSATTGPPVLSQPLKFHQRKVTAILSRLVLSVRALVYNSGSSLPDTVNRIQNDAEELLKDVHKFVSDAQFAMQSRDFHENSGKKRLEGVFSVAGAGIGLIGGGSAASWKGFGYHERNDSSNKTRKTLTADVILDIDLSVDQLYMKLSTLKETLRAMPTCSVLQVCSAIQHLITHTSTFLSSIADIYVAQHVDVDGTRYPFDSRASREYFRMVEDAKQLVRYLEVVVQAIYDDSSSLLLVTQTLQEGVPNSLNSEREDKYDLLNELSSSLENKFLLIKQIFAGLLSLGSQQAQTVHDRVDGPAEWAALDGSDSPQGTGGHENKDQEVVDLVFGLQQIGLQKHGIEGRNVSRDYYPISTSNGLSESSPNVAEQGIGANIHVDEDTFINENGPKEAYQSNTRRPSASAKLQRLLGDEYAEKVAADLRPWYLRHNYASSDIIIDADNSVRGGTLSALVERLTAHDQADTTFTKAFLLTYKSYTTLDQLFDLLVARFRIQQPENLTQSEREEWVKMKQHVIRTRVINTMKTIVDSMLEQEDLYILDNMKSFISSEEVSGSAAAKYLLVQIDRMIMRGDAKTLVVTNQEPPPIPITPKTIKNLQLLDIDPLELARQFTIIESQLYQKIKTTEALQRARVQKVEHDDNIAAVIQMSNRIAEWVAECILSKEDARRRAQAVKHLITVADRCRALNNFSTMSAITSGLNTPPIRRLKRTWEQVNQRYMALFESCESTIDSAKIFTKYKSLMNSVVPPCVPFLGVFLSTLQFIQDGNPDYLSDNIINFRKFQKASEIIIEIKRWQSHPYNLQTLPGVAAYIIASLNKFSGNTRVSSDYFWALSLEREPREREDEKMARLLQESGF